MRRRKHKYHYSVIHVWVCITISILLISVYPNYLYSSGGTYDGHFMLSDSTEGSGVYVGQVGIANANNADGAPDGLNTNNILGSDQLILSYELSGANASTTSEICITVGFNGLSSTMLIDDGVTTHSFVNPAGLNGFALQEVCFIYQGLGTLDITISHSGPGTMRVDGSTWKTYLPCCIIINGKFFIIRN